MVAHTFTHANQRRVAEAIKRFVLLLLPLSSLLFNKLCKTRQIEFEIHADFGWLWELRYVDRQTVRQKDRQRDRQADGQTDSLTDSDADTHTHTRVGHDNASFLALTRT